jgi:hypothetical protein
MLRASTACAIVLACSQAFGGTEQQRVEAVTSELNPRRFEFALESGYLFGVINPPQDYQVGAEFLTARIRWGVVQGDSWLRGYNQFYVSAIAEPIFSDQEADSFHTSRAASARDGLTVTRKFPADRDRILRSTFYRQPVFPIS